MTRLLAFLGTLFTPLLAFAQAVNNQAGRSPAPAGGPASGSSGAWWWIIAIIVVLAIIWWAAGSRRRTPTVRP
jgi:hypothetical protein